MITVRPALLLLISGTALLAVSACDQGATVPSPDPKPQWERYAFEGVYPTMPIATVEQNLRQRGYVIEPCSSEEPQPSAPNWQDGRTNCYISKARQWRVLVGAVQTKQDYYADDFWFHATQDVGEKKDKTQPFFEEVQDQIGKPQLSNDIVAKKSQSHYWFVPGGSPTLPDMVMVRTGEPFELNYTMTSHWMPKQAVNVGSNGSAQSSMRDEK